MRGTGGVTTTAWRRPPQPIPAMQRFATANGKDRFQSSVAARFR
jgi:hypothetical protein